MSARARRGAAAGPPENPTQARSSYRARRESDATSGTGRADPGVCEPTRRTARQSPPPHSRRRRREPPNARRDPAASDHPSSLPATRLASPVEARAAHGWSSWQPIRCRPKHRGRRYAGMCRSARAGSNSGARWAAGP
eukprot:7388326-Prymnesium_polylepis.2